MQIRTRLTVLFTGLVAALLLAFALTIYIGSSQTREEEYFKRLKQQASTKANLLLDAKVSPHVLQLIYKNAPNSLFQEEVAIYDTSFNLLYHDAVEVDKVKETQGMIDSIINLKQIRFYLKDLQVVGFLYHHNQQDYVITAAAKDEYGLTKLANLRNSLIFYFLVAVIVIFFVGQFLAKQSLKPVSSLIGEVKNITANNLDLRVLEGNRKDEIAQLAITFNEMLNRLENSFDAQKQFVSNISHELRTPLAIIISELELADAKDRAIAEYRETIRLALDDSRRLSRLANNLLDLAKAGYDQKEITFKETRLDEVLLDSMQQVLKLNPGYKIDLEFMEAEADDDNFISVNGNAYLLKVAFANLMENACKFSADHSCKVSIAHQHPLAVLRFADQGIGIAEEDLPHIFTPFYRGSNKKYADGNGIGLTLTQKIITLHQGTLSVKTVADAGTTFTIHFIHI
jgi:signal transduction histidine kinase